MAVATALPDGVISEASEMCVADTELAGLIHMDGFFIVFSSSPPSILLAPHGFAVSHMNKTPAILPLTPALLCACSHPSRLRHHPEGAFSPQSFHRELPVGGDRAVPAQEAAAHPEPADPAQPQRALRGREGPSHQDPAEEMQLPQESGVSARAHACAQTHSTPLSGNHHKQTPSS